MAIRTTSASAAASRGGGPESPPEYRSYWSGRKNPARSRAGAKGSRRPLRDRGEHRLRPPRSDSRMANEPLGSGRYEIAWRLLAWASLMIDTKVYHMVDTRIYIAAS